MKPGKIYWFALLLIAAYGCKVPYQPPVSNATTGYLVVDGVINDANGSTDSTFLKLSRTSKLSASDVIIPELHAQVSVEDGQGFSVTLKETINGNYVSGPLGLDSKKQYRLRVKTAGGETYLSDLVSSVYSPPIDSIGYTVNGDQATIYANAHNPANNTRYYRWNYTETWEVLPAYTSFYMTNGSAIVVRDAAHQYPQKCWQNDASTNIVLASTSKLVNDVVYQAPITYITGTGSKKLSFRYSILLKQYGLTQAAYTFWSQEQKNTESLGSIFDAQPSQINGNIHSTTNPTEPVFGYISVTNVQIKRAYINRSDMPSSFQTQSYNCELDSVFLRPNPLIMPPQLSVQKELIPLDAPLIPLDGFCSPPPATCNGLTGYISTTSDCVDCSVYGSKIKPYFWTGP